MHKQNGVIVFTHKMKSCVHELFPCAHFLPRGGELLGGHVGSVTSTTKGKIYISSVLGMNGSLICSYIAQKDTSYDPIDNLQNMEPAQQCLPEKHAPPFIYSLITRVTSLTNKLLKNLEHHLMVTGY